MVAEQVLASFLDRSGDCDKFPDICGCPEQLGAKRYAEEGDQMALLG